MTTNFKLNNFLKKEYILCLFKILKRHYFVVELVAFSVVTNR